MCVGSNPTRVILANFLAFCRISLAGVAWGVEGEGIAGVEGASDEHAVVTSLL